MDFKVFLSNEALTDLERIVAYVAVDNPAAAERLGNQLLDAALALCPTAVGWCRNSGGENCGK
jgi:plasmid stabilization system protein ParE